MVQLVLGKIYQAKVEAIEEYGEGEKKWKAIRVSIDGMKLDIQNCPTYSNEEAFKEADIKVGQIRDFRLEKNYKDGKAYYNGRFVKYVIVEEAPADNKVEGEVTL